jgi:PAS domain S-box-containing protein
MAKDQKKKGNSSHPVLVVGIPKIDESMMEEIFEKLPIMGYTIGLNGVIINSNSEAERRLGYSKKELIGMPLKKLYAPPSLSKAKRLFLQWQKTGMVKNEELQVLSKKGEVIDVLLNVATIHGPAGNSLYSLSMQTDVTRRKRAEEEASRMATMVRDSNDAITIQDFKGNILAWNHGAEQMFGYSEKEALKMKIWLLAPVNKLEEQKNFNRRIFAGEKVSSFETQRLTKDGCLLDVWLTVTKLVDDAGKIIGIASTERDITERKRQDELKDQFLNMTSHELKSPLLPIKSQCQLLLDGDYGPLNKEQKEAVEMIEKNEDHLERLVTDVLDIARVKSKKIKLIFEKAHIGEIVSDSVKDMRISAKKRSITLSLKIIPILPDILIDSSRITQVIFNLLTNAIKYTPKKGIIDVLVGKTKDNIEVSVHDNGIGMDKEALEKIFTPFFQADAGFSRKYGGMGLGLSICKGIIEAHGGKIWGSSEGKNKGSTFTFTLPLTPKNI